MGDAQDALERWDDRAYAAKPHGYFLGARADFISELPVNLQARILEIGCGEGGTGSLALEQRRCGTYCGVELFPSAADKAKDRISEVVVGNIEETDLPWPGEHFDVLILSEILEHLVDPWTVLKKLHPLLKPGARVFASSPNVANYRIIRMLMRGEWNLTDMGLMDRTHLRWFTPRSYRDLFESCGYAVDSVGQVGTLSSKAKVLSLMSFGRLRHLFITQLNLRAHRL
jgi:2-polyprenyl-3-methyl-5-hydroxy-6-metoxy-1,4-benzoquinol methylase